LLRVGASATRQGWFEKEREILTLEQQEKLLKFVEQSNVYKPHLPMMQVMLGACLRVSETIGLT